MYKSQTQKTYTQHWCIKAFSFRLRFPVWLWAYRAAVGWEIKKSITQSIKTIHFSFRLFLVELTVKLFLSSKMSDVNFKAGVNVD